MQAYYASRAPEYDRVYQKPERQDDLRAMERWLPTVFAGKDLLEVACGTGYWTQFLAPVAKRIVAVDAAPETMAIARSRVASPRVTFVEGDAYRVDAIAKGHDAGFAGFWISHVPRSRRLPFLHAFHRALRPGARVVMMDNREVAGSTTPIAFTDEAGDSFQDRRLADGSTYRVLKNFPGEAELRALLRDLTTGLRYHAWQHYWAIEYEVAEGPR